MQILQTRRFEREIKKLHKNQKPDLDKAVKEIVKNPDVGQEKLGDLSGVRVHKFRMVNQLTLLAYMHERNSITLLAVGTHENFYRDLKKN